MNLQEQLSHDHRAFLANFLSRNGFIKDGCVFDATALNGGVSSDVWKITVENQQFCVKRSVPELRVRQSCSAPLARNTNELNWFNVVSAIEPHAVPKIRAHDEILNTFAMDYYPPDEYPVWKDLLKAGHADAVFSAAVGSLLGRIHESTASERFLLESQFLTHDIFDAMRVEPYFKSTARRHPDVASHILETIYGLTAEDHRKCLIHGDVSPKNILVGPNGPVLLDAECAWFADPAFDVAFCLTHLMLKMYVAQCDRKLLYGCAISFHQAYVHQVVGEDISPFTNRVLRLVPCLILARIDGKIPIEYIDRHFNDKVRTIAKQFMIRQPLELQEMLEQWMDSMPQQ